MLKKIMKAIRRNLLKIDWIKLEAEAYQVVQKERLHHEHWAKLMHSGCKVRNLTPMKLEPWDTLPVVGEGGTIEERLGGKVIETGWIDSTNWGRIHS